MASAGTKEINYDREKYQSDSMYRAIMNLIHVPSEMETADSDDYTEFFDFALNIYGPPESVAMASQPEPESDFASEMKWENALKDAKKASIPEDDTVFENALVAASKAAKKSTPTKKGRFERADTTNAEIEIQAKVYKSILDTMKIGDKNIHTFQVKDIKSLTILESYEFILPKYNSLETLILTDTCRITLKQNLRISKVIILELVFIVLTQSQSQIFNSIHLSFWPRKALPKSNPLGFSRANLSLFEKGSIHIVLENVKGILQGQNKGVIYLKLRIDDKKKIFYPTDEDFDSIGEYDNGIHIQRFLKLIIDILNSTSDSFFPILGAKVFRKTKRRTKRKRDKRKRSKRKRSKRKKTR